MWRMSVSVEYELGKVSGHRTRGGSSGAGESLAFLFLAADAFLDEAFLFGAMEDEAG